MPKVIKATMLIEFNKPQDLDVDCNELNDVYLTLDKLLEAGVIKDYNCSTFEEVEDVAKMSFTSLSQIERVLVSHE